jgi:hypothetical protein
MVQETWRWTAKKKDPQVERKGECVLSAGVCVWCWTLSRQRVKEVVEVGIAERMKNVGR